MPQNPHTLTITKDEQGGGGNSAALRASPLAFDKNMNTIANIEKNKIAHIAHSFRTDAYFFLEKVSIFRISSQNPRTSLIAKLIVDLLMSCECSLKSIYATSATSSAEEIMKKIKRCFRHNIGKLLDCTSSISLTNEESSLLRRLSSEGVRLRYSSDLFSVCDYAELLQEQSDIQMTLEREQEIAEVAKKLLSQADKIYKSQFPDTSVFIRNQQEGRQYIEALRKI